MGDKRLELAQYLLDALAKARATPSERAGALAVALELTARDSVDQFKADLGVVDLASPPELAPCS